MLRRRRRRCRRSDLHDAEPGGRAQAAVPRRAGFSTLAGEPLHFTAYAADPKANPSAPPLGVAFWTTDLVPQEHGYHGPIHILVGMDMTGVLTGVVVTYNSEPYGYFSVEPPKFAMQFKGKKVSDPFRVGGDVDAVSRASISIASATRAIRDSARHGRQAAAARGGQVVDPAVEGWREILRPQALDLALLAAFIALALVSFFRKSVALKYVTLRRRRSATWGSPRAAWSRSATSSGSPISACRSSSTASPGTLFMLFVVVSTVLWGRVYCGRVCAFGALTQLMDPIIPRKMRVEIPVRIEKYANLIKYGVLAARARLLPRHARTSPVRSATPSRSGCSACSARPACGSAWRCCWSRRVFVRNLYCRFLCPVGAALGIISQLTTVFRIKRWAECKTCKICEKTCEWGAIRGPQIVKSECVRCDDCERLYMDQKKCPHWLILFKRKGNTAVPISTPN